MVTVLRGRVRSGHADLSHWMRLHAAEYARAVGVELVPGSLNVELEREWGLSGERIRLEAEQVGVGMSLVPCRVFDQPAFIARTDRNEAGTGGHPRTIVEIVAPVHLRDRFALEDGDEVEVTLGAAS